MGLDDWTIESLELMCTSVWGNSAALVGFPQDVAKHALSTLCKTVVIRARSFVPLFFLRLVADMFCLLETRKTYRAVLSAPVLVIPEVAPQPESASIAEEVPVEEVPLDTPGSTTRTPDPQATNSKPIPGVVLTVKRPLEEDGDTHTQSKKRKRRRKSGQQSK